MPNSPDLCSEIRSCKKCDLQYSRKKPVCGFGSSKAKMMIIGEAPGAKEDESGKPFVGRSGKLLDIALELASIRKKDIYITNSVKCRPKIGKAPRVSEIRSCSGYLREEMDRVTPNVLVPMGNSAIKALGSITNSNLGRISEMNGQIFYSHMTYIIPQFHPAAILRNPKKMEFFKDSFSRMSEFLYDVENTTAENVFKKYNVKKI